MEQRALRWVQTSLARYDNMVTEGELVRGHGFKYEKEGNTYIELHRDDHTLFQADWNHLSFGDNLSMHKGVQEKTLIMLDQDKCIFKQYNLSLKSWSDPNRTRALLPKDKGQGVMISAFVSREFGFGMTPTPDQLNLINSAQSNGKSQSYSDECATISKNGTKKKHY
jgi:hypothetical protein